MTKEWTDMTAAEKQMERFNRWLSADGINFINEEAEAKYKKTVSRIIDAITLKEPDRVPVVFSPAHVPARYTGYTVREVMYEADKMTDAWLKFINDFELDVLPSASLVKCGQALELMDVKEYKWAGHGLPDNSEPQALEIEKLKGDEWDHYNNDPSDFQLRRLLPRVSRTAEPLEKLPPLSSIGYMGRGHIAFADPEIQEVFRIIGEAGKVEAEWMKATQNVDRKGIESGLPKFSGSMGGAPFDYLTGTLRGTKGVISDMFRQPDILIEAQKKMIPQIIRTGVAMADMSGIPIAFFPLHRGADGFMSDEQFNTFYWPYFKEVILGFVEEGVVPFLFAEGGFTTRLETIQELPKGSVIWHFDRTDIVKAKEILGGKSCIMGNVPASLMVTGSKGEVIAYCKNLIETAGKDGGYILAPGASADQTRFDNIKALMEAAKTYGVYR